MKKLKLISRMKKKVGKNEIVLFDSIVNISRQMQSRE